MPYVDTVNDVMRVTMAVNYSNKQVQEASFHLLCTTSGGGDSRPTIASQVNSLVSTYIIGTLFSTATYLGCRVAPIQAAQPWAPVIVDVENAGTSPGTVQLPTQVRGVMKMFTALYGRKYRGRLYTFTPTTDNQDADGHPTAAYGNKWFSVLDQFRAGLVVGGSTWQLVIYHRLKVPAPFTPPTPVIKVEHQELWGTQRRSGDFGRPNVLPW